MVSAKEKEIIVNAIRVLRSRRVRPSQRKISWYVRREHLLPETTTDAVLDQLVESEEVLRVSYKGATSYRVAANWSKAALVRRRPTRTKVNVMNSESTCRTLRAAVAAACGPYGGGATKDNIEVHLRAAGHDRLLDKLDVLLHREMRSGSLLRVVTTHKSNEVVTFILPPTPPTGSLLNTTPDTPVPSPPDNIDSAAAALGKWRCTIGDPDQQDVDGDGGPPMEEDTSSPLSGDPQQESTQTTTTVGWTHNRGSNINQSAISYDSQLESVNSGREARRCVSKGVAAMVLGGPGAVVCSSVSAVSVAAAAESEASLLVRGGKVLHHHRDDDRTSHLSQHQHRMALTTQPEHSAMPRQPSKRNKRAKKVFDPSELQGLLMNQAGGGGLHVPLSGIGQTIPVPLTAGVMLPQRKVKPQPNRCDVCTFTVNHLNMHEDLLICHNCSARAHPSCLGYSAELAIRSHLAPWTCMDCKHCAICNMDHNIGTLIFCDECDQAYHLTCHQPPLSEQPQGSWICFNCIPQTQSNHNGYECVAGLPTPRDSPVPDDESRGSTGGPWDTHIIDSEIPNATHWSIDQVVQHFDEKGFEDNAQVFRHQDIDGTALLMLTRNDVLCGLQLKLGPALKMYKHVRILQTRLLNPPLP